MLKTIPVGETLKLAALWSTASKDVATVDQSGVVTAVSPGTVEIYCAIGDAAPSVAIVTVAAEAAVPA